MDQHRRNSGTEAGPGRAAEPRSLAVYEAELIPAGGVCAGGTSAGFDAATAAGPTANSTSPAATASVYRDGFTGSLSLQNVEALDDEAAGTVLSSLDRLMRWAQAQQALSLIHI